MNTYRALMCGVAALGLQSSLALAAEPTSAEAIPADDIVVTAQRRAEPLQKVPIAVTAIQPAQLKEQNITDLISLRSKLATFDVRTTGVSAGIYIRGVGQNGAFANNENSVAMYVDDVYMGLAQMTKTPFNIIEQVVVLKGPQGTLFGRNATGGVIQITTANPSHDSRLDATIGYGNFDTVKASVYTTGELSDKGAVNFSAIYDDQGKGWGRNQFLDEEILFKKTFGARSKVLFEPSEATELLLTGDYAFERNSGLDHHPTPGNPRLNTYPANIGPFDTYAGFHDEDTIRHGGVSLKVTQELGFANLVSTSAYRKMRAFQSVDQDATPASQVSVHSFFGGTQWTQELQLLSNADSKLKWTAGAFYIYATPYYKQDFFELSRRIESKQLTKSIAVYGQATYPIFDGTNITGGLRYTHEDQKLVDSFQIRSGVTTNFPNNHVKVGKLTWRVSLDQQLSDGILAYVSYNRGIHSGGFNQGAPTAPPYAPEKIDAYEVGLKTQLFNRRVRLNVAAFYYDYANLQVAQAIAGTSFLTNAASARIYGVDGDIDIKVTDNLSLFGNWGILDTKYTSFPNSVAFDVTGAAVGGPGGLDVTGNDITFAPHFTGSVGARYQTETSIGKVTLSGNVNHYSGAFTSPDNTARLTAYDLVNASIQWLSPSGKFDVRLWGSNLMDKYYLGYTAQNGVGRNVTPGEPRTYGVTIGVHY